MKYENSMNARYQELKEFNIHQLKNQKISYYIKEKKHLGFYDMEKYIPKYRQIKQKMKEDGKLHDSIKKIIAKSCVLNKHMAVSPLSKLAYRESISKEWNKIKKYHKISTSSDIADTVQTTLSLCEFNLLPPIDSDVERMYTNFCLAKENVIKGIQSHHIMSPLLSSPMTEKFFSLSYKHMREMGAISVKEVLEYKLLIKEILKFVTKYTGEDLFILNNTRTMCQELLEFLYFSHTAVITQAVSVTRYLTGQGEHQTIFTQIMRRMIWYLRLIDKKEQFTPEDIFFFLEVYISNYPTLLDITENLLVYLEYNKQMSIYNDVVNALRLVAYNTYLETAMNEDLDIMADNIKNIITKKILSYLDDKIL